MCTVMSLPDVRVLRNTRSYEDRRRVQERDDELLRRLGRRFGSGIEGWLDELPAVLTDLAERWQIEFESLVPRGSVSVVVRGRMADNCPAVLKLSPDRRRIRDEAAALASWKTVHVPAVLAVDQSVGAQAKAHRLTNAGLLGLATRGDSKRGAQGESFHRDPASN